MIQESSNLRENSFTGNTQPRDNPWEGVKKLGLLVGQEYLQSFTNAVVSKAKVTRLCK
jgi:hypothetical protein